MVEVITNSLGYALIDGLSFKLADTTSYVTHRRSSIFHSPSKNIYNSDGGLQLININISGNDWLNPSTFGIMMTHKIQTPQLHVGFAQVVDLGHLSTG